MNWRSVKFDWNHARAFLVTAEEGSLSAAARVLGMTQPTLSRQVDALQSDLGVILFERTGRGLVLTPSGRELLEEVRGMGDAASRVSISASGRSQVIEGEICITASDVYASTFLAPIVTKLRTEHPGIEVEIVAANGPTDLRRREADIALRNFISTQPDLIVKKVRDDYAHMYATDGYLASIGYPRTLADLESADFVGYANTDWMMKGLNELGLNIQRKNFKITCDNHLVQWAFVKAGAGIGLMTENVAMNERDVRRVLPDMAPIPVPTWLVTHRELNTSKRMRTVFDFLASHLAARS
jgi:DNA-binding transcriptional LysR family regulator